MRARTGLLVAMLGTLVACSSLLPDGGRVVETPWKSYADAEAMYNSIVPGKTTLAQLKEMGIDPQRTANVEILSYADLLRRLQPMIQFEGPKLEPAIAQCVGARQACFAYRIEQQWIDRERVGNFWVDFLNFRRTTNVTGWQFDALIMINHDVVTYKTWSGKPHIREVEQDHHPLGPLQGLGSSLH
jgi:hypothetical protein